MTALFRKPMQVAALLAAAAVAAAPVAAQTTATRPAPPFQQLGGSWSGGGQVRFADGKTERISCRAYYVPKADGDQLGLAIRCASVSYKIEIRANLVNDNGRLSGRWEERTFNAAGEANGRFAADKMTLAVTGGGFSGAMTVTTAGAKQVVTISTEGIKMRSVNVTLGKS